MGKISTYAVDSTPSLSDKLIGTEVGSLDATKNYTIQSIVSLANTSLGASQVLNAYSIQDQEPVALNTALVVEFGPAQGSPSTAVQLDVAGKITFNESGLYLINGFGSIWRQGSSGGVAIFGFRGKLNGAVITQPKTFHINSTNVAVPYEITIPFQATAGDIFWFEVVRDSSGVDQGGLYPTPMLSGWGVSPSSQVQIWKLS